MNQHQFSISIRELNLSDTGGFLALKQRGLTTNPDSFVATLEDDPPSYPEMVQERLRRASIQSGDIILGAFAPDLIGIVAITRDARTKRQHKADLHGMYVMPEYRGRGLGKTLLQRSLEMARSMVGLEEIQLIVATHNQEAVALYERNGFLRVWTECRALTVGGSYVDAHHMILAMTPEVAGSLTNSNAEDAASPSPAETFAAQTGMSLQAGSRIGSFTRSHSRLNMSRDSDTTL